MQEPSIRKLYERMESGDRDNAVAVNEERDERIATELRMRPCGINALQFYREKHL